MIRGKRADEAFEKGLDTYLATVTDHGFNASTFTARVVASTRAGLISSVLAALCALKGPLHGGAPGPVLDMFDEIGTPERAEAWLDDAFAKGTRLMGFGHRVYKKRDPRADVLKNTVATLPQTAGRLAFAVEVERSAIASLRRHKPKQRLDTNVEYYTALLLEALDVPRSAFTALFAVGRAAGWCAHVFEQEKGRAPDPAAVDLRRPSAAVERIRCGAGSIHARCGRGCRSHRRPRGSRRRRPA